MELTQRLEQAPDRQGRFTFLQKPIAAIALVGLADLLFYWQRIGSTLGLFCLTLLAFVLISRPQILRCRHSAAAAAGAGLFGIVNLLDPHPLALALFWLSITLAVLLPRAQRFDDGWQWTKRLVRYGFFSTFGLLGDARRLSRVGERRPLGLSRRVPVLLMPLIGSAIFLALFASANPLIEDVLGSIDFMVALERVSIPRLFFWGVMLVLVWSLLRPRPVRIDAGEWRGSSAPAMGARVQASVTLSLVSFNLVFALQNGLDIAFLWSNAPLPEGMTLAEYAHRGAYPLILTALLAGLFVLVTLRPGSPTADSALVRRLVYLWIGQNIFLVASTMLRTLDYIDAYSLTRLRIAALIWMALVAAGLLLICIRIWRSKSGAWLINANLAAALLVLGLCSVVDLGRVAAGWNVRHAREAGGRGANLDICYLRNLGPSALLPIIELEARTANPILKERLGSARIGAIGRLAEQQGDWRGWTARGAWRLAAARDAVAQRQLPASYGGRWSSCDGPVPLTAAPAR